MGGFHSVISLRKISSTAIVLRFTRLGLEFIPGMHLSIGTGPEEVRPYTIYSGTADDFLEILVKVIPDGRVSLKLDLLKPGDEVWIENLRGHFVLPEERLHGKMGLIATGTGIAPFHSYIRSYPELDYHLFHGIRDVGEIYDLQDYQRDRVTICTTRDDKGDFRGRITKLMLKQDLSSFQWFYLCGNYEMVDEVYEILVTRGVNRQSIKTEGYF